MQHRRFATQARRLSPSQLVASLLAASHFANNSICSLYTSSRTTFSDYVQDGTILNNYAHIFDLLMRMRQAVGHPYLVLHSKSSIKSGLSDDALRAAGYAPPSTDRSSAVRGGDSGGQCVLCSEQVRMRVYDILTSTSGTSVSNSIKNAAPGSRQSRVLRDRVL